MASAAPPPGGARGWDQRISELPAEANLVWDILVEMSRIVLSCKIRVIRRLDSMQVCRHQHHGLPIADHRLFHSRPVNQGCALIISAPSDPRPITLCRERLDTRLVRAVRIADAGLVPSRSSGSHSSFTIRSRQSADSRGDGGNLRLLRQFRLHINND